MSAGDVCTSFKKRLARFAATFLETVEETPSDQSHPCQGPITEDDAASIEKCVTASPAEEGATAYVAGWLEKKGRDELIFLHDEPLITGNITEFIEEVSRGYLTVPHACTYDIVRIGLSFMNHAKDKACCHQRLVGILSIMDTYYDLGLSSPQLFRRLANVLLHGLQKLERDQEKNAALYQTSLKKARLAE